jgi:hypothetical protein
MERLQREKEEVRLENNSYMNMERLQIEIIFKSTI